VSSNEGLVGTELTAEPGSQILLSLSSMQSPLTLLPPDARRNLIVVSSEPPTNIAETVTAVVDDLDTVAHVPISGSETEYSGPMWTCDPLVPDDLTGLSMRLSRAFEALGQAEGYLLVENLSVFLLYAAHARVIRFLDHVTGLAEDHGITGVYGLVGDAVDEETYDRLRLTVDTEIDCR